MTQAETEVRIYCTLALIVLIKPFGIVIYSLENKLISK